MTVGMDYCVLNYWKYNRPPRDFTRMSDIYYRTFFILWKTAKN
jgi:hypothetical protein